MLIMQPRNRRRATSRHMRLLPAAASVAVVALLVATGCASTSNSASPASTAAAPKQVVTDPSNVQVFAGDGTHFGGYSAAINAIEQSPGSPYADQNIGCVDARPGLSQILTCTGNDKTLTLKSVGAGGITDLTSVDVSAIPDDHTVANVAWNGPQSFLIVDSIGDIYQGAVADGVGHESLVIGSEKTGAIQEQLGAPAFTVFQMQPNSDSSAMYILGRTETDQGTGDTYLLSYSASTQKWSSQRTEMKSFVVAPNAIIYGAWTDQSAIPSPGRIDAFSYSSQGGLAELPDSPFGTGQWPYVTIVSGQYLLTVGSYVNSQKIADDGSLQEVAGGQLATSSVLPNMRVVSGLPLQGGALLGLSSDADRGSLATITVDQAGKPALGLHPPRAAGTGEQIMMALASSNLDAGTLTKSGRTARVGLADLAHKNSPAPKPSKSKKG